MSTQNVISYALTPEDKSAIDTSLTSLEGTTGKFAVPLTPDQKNGLVKPGNNYTPLIDKAARVPDQFPQIFPPTFSIPEFKKDLTLRADLTAFRDRLIKLSESIDNTLFAVNSDCFAETLKVYGFVEANKDAVPGINQLAGEMETFFSRSSRAAAPVTPLAQTK
jgi:hypothetical protein